MVARLEVGGQGGCEPRNEFIVKIKKSREVGSVRGGGGCQVGSERRINVIVKMQKKNSRGEGEGVGQGGGENEEFKLLQKKRGVNVKRRIEVIVKMQKKSRGGGGPGLVGGWVRGWSGEGGWLVVRLGIGNDVWYGGCEPRIEGIVQCT